MKASFSRAKIVFISVLSAIVFILIWKLVSLRIGTDIILPSPETVLLRLLKILISVKFWFAVGATALRILYGLVISFIVGFFAGFACGKNVYANAILSPIISITRTTPVMSIILLAMIWFKTDFVPVFVSILMIFPIITANVSQGVKNIDKRFIELGQVYHIGRFDFFINITLPSIAPFVFAGLRSSIGLAWKVVIAAEVLSQPIKAIGTNLQFSQMNLETADVIAWTVAAVILGRISERILDFVVRNKRWESP
ncbi:MAG: ABC transporter permease subunit [Spirochaetales bacterium]|nr:ABC transporter permease subunit [Spirochaetales bacterium]